MRPTVNPGEAPEANKPLCPCPTRPVRRSTTRVDGMVDATRMEMGRPGNLVNQMLLIRIITHHLTLLSADTQMAMECTTETTDKATATPALVPPTRIAPTLYHELFCSSINRTLTRHKVPLEDTTQRTGEAEVTNRRHQVEESTLQTFTLCHRNASTLERWSGCMWTTTRSPRIKGYRRETTSLEV